MLKKFIGDKKFYKTAVAVALPIMLQNGITNFVSLLDNVMVGSLGDCQLSGVAIVNRLMFIFMLAVFGAISGAGIFTAQFYGKRDEEGVRQTLRFKYLVCTVITVAAAAIFLVFGEELIRLFLQIDGGASDAEKTAEEIAKTLEYGKQYLAVSVIGLLPFALSQAYSGTMRETEHTVSPMIAGFIAVAVNCLGNYIFIFGNFGAPKLGVMG
ncbi:MAG: MATE family efflux transporter, partial [Candidatus Neoclostridium sp.]